MALEYKENSLHASEYESKPAVGSVVLVLTLQIRSLELSSLAPMSLRAKHVGLSLILAFARQRLDLQSKLVS